MSRLKLPAVSWAFLELKGSQSIQNSEMLSASSPTMMYNAAAQKAQLMIANTQTFMTAILQKLLESSAKT